LIHRVAAMAANDRETLPHDGVVITLRALTGLTHRQAYSPIVVITVLKTLTVFALAVAVPAFGDPDGYPLVFPLTIGHPAGAPP
jgi:H+/gluconate symporter-like permease